MNVIEQIKQTFKLYLEKTFDLDKKTIENCNLELNVDPAKQQFGDISTNVAMILAKKLKQDPRDLALQIAKDFSHDNVEKIEVAGPGFLNLYLKPESFHSMISQMISSGDNFFKISENFSKKRFNIEFVSANPTGPLHLGHGRGGIIGDVLGNILNFVGHHATKEFYINDAGAQIQKLGKSFKARCEQSAGIDTKIPEDGYQGEYLIDLAKHAISEFGPNFAKKSQEELGQYAKEKMLMQLEKTLSDYGITFDVWFSEKSLHESGSIQAAFDILEKKGYLYEKDHALWFKSTQFGDDKDRVVRKSSGDLTYVASDIAYMENKVERRFDYMIMILGHDHHSYSVRLEGLRQALDIKAPLHVILYQLVKMKTSGQMVRMSKRAGNIVTLKEIIDEVGVDVARFFYLNRKADAQLEFDLDLALKKTEENPVYYAQYAYVRTGSILEKAPNIGMNVPNTKDQKSLAKLLSPLGESEKFLIKKMVSLKQLLENISINFHTHLLAYYVLELAHAFHSYYSKNRVLDEKNKEKSVARLLLITQLREVFVLTLKILGISRPARM